MVTYYPPPDPYGYLYSWVPYSFWSLGFLYPGFFILRDFHRHVLLAGKPFLVTNHLGFGSSRRDFRVDPDHHRLQPQLRPNPLNSPQVFGSSQIQSNARAIIAREQHGFLWRPAPSGPVNTIAPRSSPSASLGFRPSMPPLGSMGNGAWGHPEFPQARTPTFIPPDFHGRSYIQFPAPSFHPPAFPRAGGNFQGGFPRSGGGFGGFRGGSGLGGFQGSFGGGARGGHR